MGTVIITPTVTTVVIAKTAIFNCILFRRGNVTRGFFVRSMAQT